MFGVVVGIDVDSSSGHQDEGGVDVDGEADVAVLVPVDLELGLLLVVVEGLVVLLLLVLHLLLDHLVDLTEPLHPYEHLGLSQFEVAEAADAVLVDVVEDGLVVGLALDEGRVVLGQGLVLFLGFLQEDAEVVGLHEHNGPPHELQDADVLDELGGHLEGDLERARALHHILLELLIAGDLLAVPPQPGDHFLDLRGGLVEVLDQHLQFVLEFAPVGLAVGADGHPELTHDAEEDAFLCIAPALLIFLTLSLVLKVDFPLVLLNLHDGVDQLLESASQIVGHREVLVGLRTFQLGKAVLLGVANRNIVGISVLIDPQQQVDVVLLAPPDSRSLPKQQAEGDEVEQTFPDHFASVGWRHVLEGVLPVLVDEVTNTVQELQSFGVLYGALGKHDMLVPFLEVRLELVVLRLVLLDQLLQEQLQTRLVLGKRQAQGTQETVSIGFYLRQRFVLQFAPNRQGRTLNLLPTSIAVLQQEFLELLVVVTRPFAATGGRKIG